MEGHCSTDQSPQWAVVPMEEEDTRLLRLLHYTSLVSDVSNLKHTEDPVRTAQ